MLTDKQSIHTWLKKYSIKDYHINENLIVDLEEHASLHKIEEAHLPIQFGKCRGHFFLDQTQLKTLKGVPYEVGGFFYLRANNHLTLLDFLPKMIGRDLIIDGLNNIFSLIHLDKSKFSFLEIFQSKPILQLEEYEVKDKENSFHYCLKYDSVINKALPIIQAHYEKGHIENTLSSSFSILTPDNKKFIKV